MICNPFFPLFFQKFEKREKPLVKKAAITKNILTFEYLTPLAGTDCKTVAKVIHVHIFVTFFSFFKLFYNCSEELTA